MNLEYKRKHEEHNWDFTSQVGTHTCCPVLHCTQYLSCRLSYSARLNINCFLLPSPVPFSTLFQRKIILSSLRPEAALEWQSPRSGTPVGVTLKATLGLGALPKLTWAPVRQRTLLAASGFLWTKTNHTGPEKRSVRTDLRDPPPHRYKRQYNIFWRNKPAFISTNPEKSPFQEQALAPSSSRLIWETVLRTCI